MQPGERVSRSRIYWGVTVCFVTLFLLLELGVRFALTRSPEFVLFGWGHDWGITDPVIGRMPLGPGLRMYIPGTGVRMTIGDYGVRRNGDTPPPAERPLILAVGDSFTFGENVTDEDTWPAVLERLSGRRALNGGVQNFGVDQIVLRAEQLAMVYAPETIVVSFIPNDVIRTEASFLGGHAKPYFEVDGEMLRLHPPPLPPLTAVAAIKRLVGGSVAADLFIWPLLWQRPNTIVHRQGREVSCLLMARLAQLGQMRRVRIVVLAQPQAPNATGEDVEMKSVVLGCAQANHLETLDLFPILEGLTPAQRDGLFAGHMNAEGNRWVATELARVLGKTGSPAL